MSSEPYPPHARGAASEQLAASVLTRLGWWVAIVSAQHAPFDLVAVRVTNLKPSIHLIDVKTLNPKKSARNRTALQRVLGVKNLYVDLETGGVSTSPAIAATGDHANPLASGA